MSLTWKGGGPRALQRKLFAAKRAMERETLGALGTATTVLENSIKRRTHPARRVNQQDAPAGRPLTLAGRSPIRTRIDAQKRTSRVTVARHWTHARTRAVEAIFKRQGQANKLLRRGLFLRDWGFVPFSSDPGLLRWAQKPEKGQQVRRHAVRLSEPKTIQLLELQPAVAECAPLIHQILRAAYARGVKI